MHKTHLRRLRATACGTAAPAGRVTDIAGNVTCMKCRKSVPPTPAEVAELFARLDAVRRRPS